AGLDEPDAPIGMCRHCAWLAVITGNCKLADAAIERNAADAVACGFAEPHGAVTRRNGQRPAPRRDPILEFRNLALRGDAADLIGVRFREPHIAVGADQRAVGTGIRRRQGKQRDLALHGDAADLVRLFRAEPHIAVSARCDANRRCPSLGKREFSDVTVTGVEPADLRGAAFTKPQAAVRAGDADVGTALFARNFVDADRHCLHTSNAGTWTRHLRYIICRLCQSRGTASGSTLALYCRIS